MESIKEHEKVDTNKGNEYKNKVAAYFVDSDSEADSEKSDESFENGDEEFDKMMLKPDSIP